MDPRYFKFLAGLILILLFSLFKACTYKSSTANVDDQYPLPPYCKEVVLMAPKWNEDTKAQFLEYTGMNWVTDAKGSEEAAFKAHKQYIQQIKQEHNLNNSDLMNIWKEESKKCERALSKWETSAPK